jgi:hypothetical protein
VRPKVDFRSAVLAAGSPKAIATGTKRDPTTRARETSPIANRSELQGTQRRLSQHPWKVFMERKHDPHRLSVHGLAYLQNLHRERDS